MGPYRIDEVVVTAPQSLWQLMMEYGSRQSYQFLDSGIDFEKLNRDLADAARSLEQLNDSRSWLRRTLDDYAPVWSFAVLADQAWARRDYFEYAGCMIAGMVEGLSLGTLSFVSATSKGVAIQGIKATVNAAKLTKNVIPKGKLANHLFKGVGKLTDTPANRALIQNISNGKAIGVDQYGKSWYMGIDVTGKSIYSYTQNGIVKGAGYATMNAEEMIIRYGLK